MKNCKEGETKQRWKLIILSTHNTFSQEMWAVDIVLSCNICNLQEILRKQFHRKKFIDTYPFDKILLKYTDKDIQRDRRVKQLRFLQPAGRLLEAFQLPSSLTPLWLHHSDQLKSAIFTRCAAIVRWEIVLPLKKKLS